MADLQVIGAGCGRTGTASLKRALEILGFPCYHMFEVIKGGHECMWERALAAPDEADWSAIFAGFRATVDFPAAVAYPELMAAYPDAKVILSVRDAPGWATSVMETIWSPSGGELSYVQAPFRRHFQRMAAAMRRRFFGDDDGGVASGSIFRKEDLERKFDEWNATVEAIVPKERLLVFRASDGWGPLCAFLGVPVPDELYPRVNDTAAFKAMARKMWWTCLGVEAAVALAVGGVAVMALRRKQ